MAAPSRNGKRSSRLAVYLVSAALITALGLVLLPSWLGLLEQSPLTYSTYVIPLTPLLANGVAPGGTVKFSTTRCVAGTKPLVVVGTNVLVRSDGMARTSNIPVRARTLDPGCAMMSGEVEVPSDLPAGLWHFDVTLVVQGKRRQHIVHWRTVAFEVKAP